MTKNVSIYDLVEGNEPVNAIYRDIFLWLKEKFFNQTDRQNTINNLFQYLSTTGYYYMQPIESEPVKVENIREKMEKSFHDAESLLKILIDATRFRYTEVGKWLIENHRPFIEEFRGSNMTKSWRLHSKRNYIKKRFESLISLGLIKKEANVKSQKNELETTLYSFTPYGIVTALTYLSFYITYDKPEKKYDIVACLGLLNAYWMHVLLEHKSSLNEFLYKFIRNSVDMNRLFRSLESIFSFLLYSYPDVKYEK